MAIRVAVVDILAPPGAFADVLGAFPSQRLVCVQRHKPLQYNPETRCLVPYNSSDDVVAIPGVTVIRKGDTIYEIVQRDTPNYVDYCNRCANRKGWGNIVRQLSTACEEDDRARLAIRLRMTYSMREMKARTAEHLIALGYDLPPKAPTKAELLTMVHTLTTLSANLANTIIGTVVGSLSEERERLPTYSAQLCAFEAYHARYTLARHVSGLVV
jgi:hypothetical protein